MSKFNPKNLSYESNEPAFLRKLRGDYGGANSVRREGPIARPRKQAINGDDDDQPTYVVEGSLDTLSKQEYEALIRKGEDGKGEGNGQPRRAFEASTNTEELQNEGESTFGKGLEHNKEKIAAIGGSQKKRNVRAIGVDNEEENPELEKKRPSKAKKSKRVKLSFDQE